MDELRGLSLKPGTIYAVARCVCEARITRLVWPRYEQHWHHDTVDDAISGHGRGGMAEPIWWTFRVERVP